MLALNIDPKKVEILLTRGVKLDVVADTAAKYGDEGLTLVKDMLPNVGKPITNVVNQAIQPNLKSLIDSKAILLAKGGVSQSVIDELVLRAAYEIANEGYSPTIAVLEEVLNLSMMVT